MVAGMAGNEATNPAPNRIVAVAPIPEADVSMMVLATTPAEQARFAGLVIERVPNGAGWRMARGSDSIAPVIRPQIGKGSTLGMLTTDCTGA